VAVVRLYQRVSKIHRTQRIISEITKDKEEDVVNFEYIYVYIYILKEIKEEFLISLDQFPKFGSVLWQVKTPIIIKTK
jgi:hypothetical protein